MTNTTAIVVEDDLFLREHFSELVVEIGLKLVGTADNAYDGLSAILRYKPDILFLDIGLPDGKSGLELAEDVQKHYQPYIFFLTSQTDSEFIRRASFLGAHSYLIKPINVDNLQAAVQLALNRNEEKTKGAYIELEYGGQIDLIPYPQILRITSDGNRYSLFITSTKNYRKRCLIAEAMELLPGDEFIRVHKSHIVRKDAIRSFIGREFLLLENGEQIPIGKTYQHFVLTHIRN